MDIVINIILIFVFLYVCYVFLKISNERKDDKLLLRMIALFVFIHLILFPVIYVFIINNDPSSIEIDKGILSSEKNLKIQSLESNYSQWDLENQISILDDILKNELKISHDSLINWELSIDFIHDDGTVDEDPKETGYEDVRGYLELESYTLSFYMKSKQMPLQRFGKFIVIDPKNKYKLFEIHSSNSDLKASEIINKNLTRLKNLDKQMKDELKIIQSNKFWTYKEVLPYSINILFTDGFKPKSRVSNWVYFVHNLIVVVFLLGLIVSLSQNYLTKGN